MVEPQRKEKRRTRAEAISDILEGRRSARPSIERALEPRAPGAIVSPTPKDGGRPEAADAVVRDAASLGAVVRTARHVAGFSQQDFADLAGVGRRFVSELENGKPTLELGKVIACCKALGIDLVARARTGL